MITIQKFTFNPFQENTYILFDETKECVIIDPGCYQSFEKEELKTFIEKNELIPKRLLNTHCHIDHVFGNYFVNKTYGLKLEMNENDLVVLNSLENVAHMYNIPNVDTSPAPEVFLNEGDKITFGNSELDILFVPGHAPGHIAFVSHNQQFVVSGDVLFQGSIGRTDLPGGDYATLEKSIKEKMYTLADDFTVYSGHGPETSIGFEKKHNGFVKA